MVRLGLVFAGLRQVYAFGEKITLSDRKPGSLNFSLVGLGGARPDPVLGWLSLDNFAIHPHTGDH